MGVSGRCSTLTVCLWQLLSMKLYSWSKQQPNIPNLLRFHKWLTWSSHPHCPSLLSLKGGHLIEFRKHSGFLSILISMYKGRLKVAHSGDSTEPIHGLIVCSKLLAIHVCMCYEVEQHALCKLQHTNANWVSFPDSLFRAPGNEARTNC